MCIYMIIIMDITNEEWACSRCHSQSRLVLSCHCLRWSPRGEWSPQCAGGWAGESHPQTLTCTQYMYICMTLIIMWYQRVCNCRQYCFDLVRSHQCSTAYTPLVPRVYIHEITQSSCMYRYVLMRDAEGRKKQGRSNNLQSKATQHTQGSHFSK